MSGVPVTDRMLGARPVEAVVSAVTSSRLRVLAYHGVPDGAAFRRQMEHLVDHYRPVTAPEVLDHLEHGRPLPRRAVWVTFDDGRPDVVSTALPVLVDLGVTATMFVCPGLFPAGSRFWQTVVLGALAVGSYTFRGTTYRDRGLVIALKSEPDRVRREVVAELADRAGRHVPAAEDTVNEQQARAWTEAGMDLGNHTWDHPCLDRCEPEEQERQIRLAHDSLEGLLGAAPRLFAYPNGDWSLESEAVLARLGYRVAPVFDHRLVARHTHPLRLSRLRVDSDAPMDRFRAVLSGANPVLFQARARLAGTGRGRNG